MLINFSSIKGITLVATEDKGKVGDLEEVVIDPDQGKILCFLVKTGFFSPLKALFPPDILGWYQEFIVIPSKNTFVEPKEIVRAYEVIKQKIKILDQKVVNQKIQTIGKVIDLTLDLETYYLSRISVEISPLKGFLESERLIPWNKIIKITKDFVMVEEIEKKKVGAIERVPEIS
ncbi:hypothetical protein E3J85_02505 [Patescibacteria group bacterium]|nr:MAG: hypothetical protein E3J85_02505 [Patescibacteria group bacterium]